MAVMVESDYTTAAGEVILIANRDRSGQMLALPMAQFLEPVLGKRFASLDELASTTKHIADGLDDDVLSQLDHNEVARAISKSVA